MNINSEKDLNKENLISSENFNILSKDSYSIDINYNNREYNNLLSLKELINKRLENLDKKETINLKHLIINLFPLTTNQDNKKKDFESLMNLFNNIIQMQINKKIPILTISFGNKENIDEDLFEKEIESLLELAKKNKINITIIGKWYDFSGFIVEALKNLNNSTKSFEEFFLNICLNYDPKQEISDASRVIIRKISENLEDFDNINPDLIKENIYSSYFPKPDLIIEPKNTFNGTFLWDSVGSKIFFLNKELQDIKIDYIEKLLNENL
ncbi:MAG: undecaprenyl diphosphate synthase family protein [Candidatus Woesearchaeota archaeon]